MEIDLDRVKAIDAFPLPSNKKALQSFLGQINFVRNFINDFSYIISPIKIMLKKDAVFSWYEEEKQAFHDIEKAIIEALVLNNLDFSRDFIMYAYGVEKSIAAILK